MRTADWRVSAVPELRAILLAEKLDLPSKVLRLASTLEPGQREQAISVGMEQVAVERTIIRALGSCDMYWVSSDMVGLALDAAADVPGFNPAADLPSPQGFMILEKPLPGIPTWFYDDDHNKVHSELEVEAITWATIGSQVVIESYCRNTGFSGAVDVFLEPVWFHTGEANGLYEFDHPDAVAGTTQLMSFLAAASLIMTSPGVADRKTLVPKTKAARKDAKKGRSANVTVIDLHTPKHLATGDADESGRVYTHRWMVRGHWRNQPHGPNRSKRSVRWIPSYIKGPAGKPLKETERVWAWRR